MTIAALTPSTATAPAATRSPSPGLARGIVAAAIVAAAVGGLMSTDAAVTARAVSATGSDLTRLLRFMAAIKALMGVGAAAAVFWRLSLPVSAPRLAIYATACAAMAAGPPLIWNLTDLAAGALLLHAGLAITVIMLWRDPAVALRLTALIAERRVARARSL